MNTEQQEWIKLLQRNNIRTDHHLPGELVCPPFCDQDGEISIIVKDKSGILKMWVWSELYNTWFPTLGDSEAKTIAWLVPQTQTPIFNKKVEKNDV